ncbi:MAG TPA: exodeoxyribonuclease VII large subunit [Candidatus Aphodoplasma excrementigallinarum]|uniref:Exodeoxyribonuclease 7 large subunit n=1 Tax=Candidatus Aphodoplasma excrementigallinarum TaxID=2840673 RepID=A0A9D1NHI9_9FIRM|nr:exodeoxyribonuclease VII large subunit [Candidatus Aphodoplasma excrementigallinarum]
MEGKIYTATVSQLNRFIKQMLDGTSILNNIWVKGEISNFKRHYTGHCYLTLKDEGGVLKAVMFKANAARLAFAPENGMKVLARGRVSVYERDGSYQLYIEEMQPDGVGSLHIAYEQLKARLQEEGLFDETKKKPLPPYPNTIGVVTATTGAAIRDIINILSRRYPCAKVLIYPTLVQGEGASAGIAEAIEYFNAHKLADVLIVGRGGGSIEDLWAFNEERTARAIYASEIPVVSAVGHETDFTIADFVADLRAPTPSAAAELVVPSVAELREKILSMRSRVIMDALHTIRMKRSQIEKITLRSPAAKLADNRVLLDDMTKHLIRNTKLILDRKREEIKAAAGRLDAMSPLAVLGRGYSIAKSKDGTVIRQRGDAVSGTEFELILSDGSVGAKFL